MRNTLSSAIIIGLLCLATLTFAQQDNTFKNNHFTIGLNVGVMPAGISGGAYSVAITDDETPSQMFMVNGDLEEQSSQASFGLELEKVFKPGVVVRAATQFSNGQVFSINSEAGLGYSIGVMENRLRIIPTLNYIFQRSNGIVLGSIDAPRENPDGTIGSPPIFNDRRYDIGRSHNVRLMQRFTGFRANVAAAFALNQTFEVRLNLGYLILDEGDNALRITGRALDGASSIETESETTDKFNMTFNGRANSVPTIQLDGFTGSLGIGVRF